MAPEAWEGGPIALVRDGDMIEIDLNRHKIELCVPEYELEERRKQFERPDKQVKGMLKAYRERVSGADEGALWLF